MHEAATWRQQTKAEADAVERSLIKGESGLKERVGGRSAAEAETCCSSSSNKEERETRGGEERVPTTTTRITIQTCSSAWLAAIAVGQERVPQGGGGGADGRGDSGIKEMTEGAGRDDAGKGAGSRSEAQAGMSCREKRQSQRQQHTGQVFEIPPAYDSLSPSQRTLR